MVGTGSWSLVDSIRRLNCLHLYSSIFWHDLFSHFHALCFRYWDSLSSNSLQATFNIITNEISLLTVDNFIDTFNIFSMYISFNLSFHGWVPVILDGVISTPGKQFCNFSPSVTHITVRLQDDAVFLSSPWWFTDIGVQVIVPSFTALFPNATWVRLVHDNDQQIIMIWFRMRMTLLQHKFTLHVTMARSGTLTW